jgi:hypothetical protein
MKKACPRREDSGNGIPFPEDFEDLPELSGILPEGIPVLFENA